MHWSIDDLGIHVNCMTIKELETAVEQIKWWMKHEPRTTQEENDESIQKLMKVMR